MATRKWPGLPNITPFTYPYSVPGLDCFDLMVAG